jgi:hypothetical protein
LCEWLNTNNGTAGGRKAKPPVADNADGFAVCSQAKTLSHDLHKGSSLCLFY